MKMSRRKQSKDDKKLPSFISRETEYNALREEKIFRYSYSNSVNTTLLTVTLAVFSVGGLLFSISEDTFVELAKIFFPLFFLLPCVFARIAFYSLLRNSVRIGLLSEYMRSHISFENNYSWEKIKKERKINYFLDPEKYIGGVKEIPLCITVVSIIFSAIITHYFVFQAVNGNICVFFPLSLSLIPIAIFFSPINNSKSRKDEIKKTISLIIIEAAMYTLYFILLKCYVKIIVLQAIYHIVLISVLCLVPNFNREIEKTDKIFKDYKQLIRSYPKKRGNYEK